MDDTPDISKIAALIGDRARAAMLMNLMGNRALTATELSRAAGVTKQTASGHLAKLTAAGLLTTEHAGRYHYYRLANHDVGAAIEKLTGLAERVGAKRINAGPADPAMRKARVCYDHLAGDFGVWVYDSLQQRELIHDDGTSVSLTNRGIAFCHEMKIDLAPMRLSRRPVCLACLDWSVRRHHLAGALGAALLDRFFALGWARQQKGTRVVYFSAAGERALRARFRLK